MTSPRLPEVELLVEDLATDIERASPAEAPAWQVDGAATVGKSALLRLLAESLRAKGLVPIVVAPPAQALDAGPLALTEIGAGMKDAGLLNGQTEVLREGERPLGDKLDQVRRWITEAQDDVVLLCDEPTAWPDRSEQSGHFAEHARVVIHELVRDIACRRVVTGDAPDAMRFQEVFRLREASEPGTFLGDPEAWGSLAASAEHLAYTLDEHHLRTFTPLQLRLLVAHVSVTSAEEVSRWLPTHRSRREIALRLLTTLAERPALHDLHTAWKRLAQVRRPFSEELLTEVVGRLSPRSDELLRRCILYRGGDAYVLHETLRRDAFKVMTQEEREAADGELELLAGHYTRVRRAEDDRRSGTGLLAAMEGFYYAARAGSRDLLADGPFFVDQLDLLGKTLSYDLRDYGGAAEVFAQAVALDSNDDYAHHYLAYNLDRAGRDPDRVEQHYRRAIELNGRHPWWRARLVSYLIVRGRTTDARTEWDSAIDELSIADREESASFYETLHGWVAGGLLRRGQLDFAEEVLSDVPHRSRAESSMITALVRRLRSLQQAERHGAFVPAQYLTHDWWRRGPFLLARRVGDDDRLLLRRWLAGRIDAIDEDTVELRVRDIALGADEPPRAATLRMDREKFDTLSRDWPSSDLTPGRFVEIGLYSDDDGQDSRRLVRVHAEREWRDETLPAMLASGSRYWLASDTG